jgi:4-hydroxybenzoate polyprenyltransferase
MMNHFIIFFLQKYFFKNINQHLVSLMRMDKPVGSWLLFWPCSWGLTLAYQSLSSSISLLEYLYYLFLLLLGAFIMRSAGCVVNDYWDRTIDAHIKRTASRPLASQLVSVGDALKLLIILLSIGAVILLQLPMRTWPIALLCSIGMIIYPLSKRWFVMPQLILGLTFSGGLMVGYLIFATEIASIIYLLYMGSVFWVIGYDTIYALQDRKGDKEQGLNSTALLWEGRVASRVWDCFLAFISMLAVMGVFKFYSLIYLVFVFGLAWFLYHQTLGIEEDASDDDVKQNKLHKYFTDHAWVGGYVFIILWIAHIKWPF